MPGSYAHAVDANQRDENDKLRQMGYSVSVTSELGRGRQDVIVGSGGRSGVNLLVEWKLHEKSKLTRAEQKFHDSWKGPLIVAKTATDVHTEMQRLLALLR